MLPLEGTLLEKLRKIEALHAGTKIDGEREAAKRAAERIRARLEELRGREKEVVLLHSLPEIDLLERTGAGDVQRHVTFDRVHQDRQAARAGGDCIDALGGVAGHSDFGRCRTGLRGDLLLWRRRAEENARRDCRET
jgi:hypothetical protein